MSRPDVPLGDRKSSIEPTPDPAWISSLTGANGSEITGVLHQAEVREGRFWGAITRAHQRAGRDFYAQIRAPFELYALTRLLQPAHVVEVGVSSGVSSAAFLRALVRNGRGTLHSIDLPTLQKGRTFSKGDSPVSLPRGKQTGWAIPSSGKGEWDLRIGRSRELLPKVVGELPGIGIFLHDSEHTRENATFEFTTVAPKLAPGSVVLADNNEWLDGALEAFARRYQARVVYRKGTDLGGFAIPK